MVKQVYRVLKMYCPTCPMRIEAIEDELPGIKRIKASYQKEQMIIEYDETVVTADQIRQAVEAKGYGLELKAA
jgi:copper chaperone CopZ